MFDQKKDLISQASGTETNRHLINIPDLYDILDDIAIRIGSHLMQEDYFDEMYLSVVDKIPRLTIILLEIGAKAEISKNIHQKYPDLHQAGVDIKFISCENASDKFQRLQLNGRKGGESPRGDSDLMGGQK
jgi:hypothetical protein